jgi:ribosomal protein S18 acetylase RimI-like enzyme
VRYGREGERFSVEVPVCIRMGRREDLPALDWDGVFARHRSAAGDALERQQRGAGVLLVADVGGLPAGQAWIDLERKAADGIGVIEEIRVAPILRGAGIGRRLVQAAERAVAERGLGVAEIGVDVANAAAHRLAERLGYRVAGRVRETYFHAPPRGDREEVTVEEWMMHKPLESVATEGWEGAEAPS